MSNRETESTDAPRKPFWQKRFDALANLDVGLKIGLLMAAIGLAPPLVALLFRLYSHEDPQSAVALYIAVFLVVFWPLVKFMEDIMVLRQARRINLYVEEVKAGRRSPDYTLPEKKGGKNDLLMLQHNIFWMVQGLKTRETKLEKALHELHQAQSQVRESLDYASLIQRAILPSRDDLNRIFGNHLLIWQPRDRVGGDAYWMKEADGCITLAVYDCTGHGVPGAFLTLIANSLFEHSYGPDCSKNPALLLTKMNATASGLMKQDQGADVLNDGFEGGICCFDQETGAIYFAGARSSMFLIQHQDVVEVRGDRHGFRFGDSNSVQAYVNHRFELNEVDGVYLFTDGITDQAGGPRGLPFGRRRLRQWLVENKDLSMDEQQRALRKVFEDYKGRMKQRDDVTFLGISSKRFQC